MEMRRPPSIPLASSQISLATQLAGLAFADQVERIAADQPVRRRMMEQKGVARSLPDAAVGVGDDEQVAGRQGEVAEAIACRFSPRHAAQGLERSGASVGRAS